MRSERISVSTVLARQPECLCRELSAKCKSTGLRSLFANRTQLSGIETVFNTGGLYENAIDHKLSALFLHSLRYVRNSRSGGGAPQRGIGPRLSDVEHPRRPSYRQRRLDSTSARRTRHQSSDISFQGRIFAR